MVPGRLHVGELFVNFPLLPKLIIHAGVTAVALKLPLACAKALPVNSNVAMVARQSFLMSSFPLLAVDPEQPRLVP